MQEVITALKNTPIWVYLIFSYLFFIGFTAHRSKKIPILKLMIVPALLTALLMQALFANVGISRMTLSVALLGFLVGAMMGWMIVWYSKVEVEPQKSILLIPGNWHTLFTILLVFATKFYYGFELERDPNMVTLTLVETSVYFILAICAGFSIGKFLNYLYHIKLAREN